MSHSVDAKWVTRESCTVKVNGPLTLTITETPGGEFTCFIYEGHKRLTEFSEPIGSISTLDPIDGKISSR